MLRDINMSKTLMKMFLFVEAEIFQGTAGVCLQDEIDMLVSNIELISQSMNKLPGMLVFFFLRPLPIYLFLYASREPVILIQCTSLFYTGKMIEIMFIFLFFQFG